MTEPTLGTLIRRARERRRWSQQQLADQLAVSLRAVNDWENDRSRPRSSIGALEEVLGTQLEPTQPGPDPAIAAAENLRRLLADHDPDIMLPDEWVERLVTEYLRLRRGEPGEEATGT